MKRILLILLILCAQLGFSQKKHFDIKWNGVEALGTAEKAYELPAFDAEHWTFEDGQVFFSVSWKAARKMNLRSLKLSNVRLETITAQELYDLDRGVLPSQVSVKGYSSNARDEIFNAIQVTPIINENGVLKRVISFDVVFNEEGITSRATTNRSLPITNSVLASGTWHKFYVEKTGVYRIDRDFLRRLGFNVSQLDPRNLKIYGNGGEMIPLTNSQVQAYDVTENAITVVGEDDGTFNNGDYILFYAVGPDRWNEDGQTSNNLYADQIFYYITTQGGPGKRIQEATQPGGVVTENYTSFDAYQYHEEDNINIVRAGRRWFGETFNIESEQTFDFNFPNLVTSEPVRVSVKPAAVSQTPTFMSVAVNGQADAINFTLPQLPPNTVYATQDNSNPLGGLLTRGLKFADLNVASNDISVTLTYDNDGNPSAVGYLDYIEVKAKRALTGTGSQFNFRVDDAASAVGVAEYTLSSASQVAQVWDVSDIFNVTKYENAAQEGTFSFRSVLGQAAEYVAVDPSDYFVPSIQNSNRTVANQDLKGTIFQDASGSFQDVDYLIITPASLSQAAQKLADHHITNSGLNTKVVTLDLIYNEFSTGNQDVGAIRNFVKYVYDNASTPDNRVKYLCMFGDASFDYKDRIPNNTNICPVFEAYESFSLTSAFASDDFYTMMDPDEGDMNGDFMDIAVGRILVENLQDGNAAVDKVIKYSAEAAFGRWRNNLVLVADDVDLYWEGSIQSNLDQLGDQLNQNKPFININKIYADAFQQESSAGGERYPQANEEILDAIGVGGLVLNYFGHGNEDGISAERLFGKIEAESIANSERFPLFMTITCEFTRFDNPFRETTGELVYRNNRGGAVGLITTTREIIVGNGIAYNDIFMRQLFRYDLDLIEPGFDPNEYPTVAEALRRAKRFFGGNAQKRVVFMIGDPAMKLAIPQPQINLTHINDVPITQPVDTLKALGYVKLSGNVTDVNGNLLSDYNGQVFTSIYDKDIDRTTLANDGTRANANGSGPVIFLNFKTLGEIIFRGKATVKDGLFDFDFIVPRDIAIPVGNGRVSFYAKKDAVPEDHTGYNLDVLIGELNENAPEDNVGPEIRLFMNDESFVSGGITNESPILLALLEDENGINTASGIGHDIIAILDGDETNPFVLNDYYETELDDYTAGRVTFPFRDLEPGLHTLTFKAWDVYNNSSTAEIQFLVIDDNEIKIERVLNYPNPFVSYTEFWFHHNRPFEPLEVQVQVFTVSGKVVWTRNQVITTDGFLSRDITWDGKDDFGDKIGKGVYVYKITVKSTLTNKKTEKFEKLVIL